MKRQSSSVSNTSVMNTESYISVVMVRVARICNAAATMIDPSYSSGGVNADPHRIHGFVGSRGQPQRHLDRFSRFAQCTGVPNNKAVQTT